MRCARGCNAAGSVRAVGIALMILGGLIVILCVPFWFWAAVLGILLLVLGFGLFRS